MTLTFGRLFPPVPNFISKGSWNDDKVQTQIIETNLWTNNTTTTTLYTCPAGKVMFLTDITSYRSTASIGFSISFAGISGLRIVVGTGSLGETWNFSPAIKLVAGETIEVNGIGGMDTGRTLKVTAYGMEEAP